LKHRIVSRNRSSKGFLPFSCCVTTSFFCFGQGAAFPMRHMSRTAHGCSATRSLDPHPLAQNKKAHGWIPVSFIHHNPRLNDSDSQTSTPLAKRGRYRWVYGFWSTGLDRVLRHPMPPALVVPATQSCLCQEREFRCGSLPNKQQATIPGSIGTVALVPFPALLREIVSTDDLYIP